MAINFIQTFADVYPYMADLMALNATLPAPLQRINTPLKVDAWQHYLSDHPDQTYVDYLLSGIKAGFRIGFDSVQSLTQPKHHIKSAYEHADIASTHLKKDCTQGFMFGPLTLVDLPPVHLNRIGVIPKNISWESGDDGNHGNHALLHT